jgi:hypothetical protein
MQQRFAGLIALLALPLLPMQLSAKGETVRVIIKGGDLPKPIEITDPEIAGRFQVGAGPGTFIQMPDGTRKAFAGQSLIVDWDRGVADPPKNVKIYDVLIVTTRSNPGTYIVHYCIDPSTNQGYVYLPGMADPEYHDNTWLIRRGIEGNWFHAWDVWEKLANPLIADGLNVH